MSCVYNYNKIFQEYGSEIRNIILNDTSKPFLVYETKPDVPDAPFYGMLIWNTQQYYSTIYEADSTENSTTYLNDIGFFVVPEFGDVKIIPSVEYRQTITMAFDTNTDPDFDPYGSKIIEFIDWYINRHLELVENLNFTLSNNTRLFCMLSNISKPIYGRGSSLLVRRSVLITLRYCRC